jgi:hypothetical protein
MVTRPRIKIDEQEKLRQQMIDRSASSDNPKDRNPEWMHFTLRIKNKTMHKIESIVDQLDGVSKTGWILQAIQEKMKRDGVE